MGHYIKAFGIFILPFFIFMSSNSASANQKYIVVLHDDSLAHIQTRADEATKIRNFANALLNPLNTSSRSSENKLEFVLTKAAYGFIATLSEDSVKKLRNNKDVRYIEENFLISFDDPPADSDELGALDLLEQRGAQANVSSSALDRIDQRTLPLNRTYNYDSTGAGVHAYIIDTGIDHEHWQFSNRIGAGAALYDVNVPIADSQDCNGHGTAVAGALGGTQDGVAKNVILHPIKITRVCGGNTDAFDLMSGFENVYKLHEEHHPGEPAVINISFGALNPNVSYLSEAIAEGIERGISIITGAGNSAVDSCKIIPANEPGVITVGAVNNANQMAHFSNSGACVDLFAPGVTVSVPSTGSQGSTLYSGTSLSSPIVAGAVALYLESFPESSPEQIKKAIIELSTKHQINNVPVGTVNRQLYTRIPTDFPIYYESKYKNGIIKEFGRSQFVTLDGGLDIPEFEPSTDSIRAVHVQMTGSTANTPSSHVEVDMLGDNKFAAHQTRSGNTRVVWFQLVDGVVLATKAGSRIGGYTTNQSNYNTIQLISNHEASSSNSAGIHDLVFDYVSNEVVKKDFGLDQLIYNGLGRFISADGLDFSDFDPETDTVKEVSVKINGASTSAGTNGYNPKVQFLRNNKFLAHIKDGTFIKAIWFEISNGKVKATKAGYKEGAYSSNSTDYSVMPLAHSSSSNGYGLHSLIIKYSGIGFREKDFGRNVYIPVHGSDFILASEEKIKQIKVNLGGTPGAMIAQKLGQHTYGAFRYFANYENKIFGRGVVFEVKNNKITPKWAGVFNTITYSVENIYSTSPIATGNGMAGIGIKNVSIIYNSPTRDIEVDDFLLTQGDLTSKLNTIDFLEQFFQTANTLNVRLADGYWIERIDLPENTDRIVVGSTINITSTATWATNFKGLFTFDRRVEYSFVYNGKTWDYMNQFGTSFVTSDPGLALDKFISPQLTPTSGTAMMAGEWIGNSAKKAKLVRLRENRLDAYMKGGIYTKVVELEVVNKRLLVKAAKYRVGEYSPTETDYVSAPIALTGGDPGYGIFNVSLMLGAYEAIIFNVDRFLTTQGDLTSKLNTIDFLEQFFQNEANTLNVRLADRYWIERIDLPENTDRIVVGSTINITSTADWATNFKGLFTFDRRVEYSFVYNGKTWDYMNQFGTSFVTSDPGLALDKFISSQLTPTSGTAMMAGKWIGNSAKKAKLVRLRENRLDAYMKGGIYTKVVELEVVNKRLLVKAAKYRVGEYIPTATDYQTAPIALTSGDRGYGIFNVSLMLGAYEAIIFNVDRFLTTQGDLTSKLNTIDFLEQFFQNEANTLNVRLFDSYWIERIDLPENTDRIVVGSTINITSTATWATNFKGLFNLHRGTEYRFVYNGNTWDLSKS